MSDTLPTLVVTDEDEAVERVRWALTMFVFPGIVVPRGEIARAVVHALTHRDDPRVGIAKTIVRTAAMGEEQGPSR